MPRQKSSRLLQKKESSLPQVKNGAWTRNGIDSFVFSKLEAKSLSPATETDKLALLRRVYFDLIRMPPSPVEASQFLNASDSSANEKLVDRLLADCVSLPTLAAIYSIKSPLSSSAL